MTLPWGREKRGEAHVLSLLTMALLLLSTTSGIRFTQGVHDGSEMIE
jgi:hypothetical protein